MKRIGLLTSGGDAPGMNAAIRAIVRSGIYFGMEVFGIERGYAGLIEDTVIPMEMRSVSNIVQFGGTKLRTARCLEMMTKEGQTQAVKTLEKHGIEAFFKQLFYASDIASGDFFLLSIGFFDNYSAADHIGSVLFCRFIHRVVQFPVDPIIGIAVDDILPGSRLQRSISRSGQPLILRVVDDLHLPCPFRVFRQHLLQYLHAPVFGTIIDKDEFDIFLHRLFKECSGTSCDVLFHSVNGNTYRYFCHTLKR